MKNQQSYAEDLKTTVWRTSGARFNAVRRLHWRERLSTVSIAVLAIIGIGFSIIPSVYSFPTDSPQMRLYMFLGIAVGVSVLVISLLEGAGNFLVKAEQLHSNARDLRALRQKIALLIATLKDGGEVPATAIEKLRDQYDQRIQECPVNHSPLDDSRFAAQHREAKEFLDADGQPRVSWLGAVWSVVLYWLQPLWVFIVVWAVIAWLTGEFIRSISGV